MEWIPLREIGLFPYIKSENGNIQHNHYKFCNGVDFFRMKMNCFVFCHHPATRPPFIRHYILWHNFQTFPPPLDFFFNFRQFHLASKCSNISLFQFPAQGLLGQVESAQLFKAPEEIANSLKSNKWKSLHPSTDIFILSLSRKINANQNCLQFDHHVGMHPTSYC